MERNTKATKRLRIETSDQVGPKRYANQNTRKQSPKHALALHCKQAKMVVHDRGQARLCDANQSETCPKLFFDQALIVEQDRQGRAGDRRDGIQEAKPHSERKTDEPFRPDRLSQARRLDQDEWKKNGVSHNLDPAGMKRGQQKASDRDTRREPDENRKHPFP